MTAVLSEYQTANADILVFYALGLGRKWAFMTAARFWRIRQWARTGVNDSLQRVGD